MSLSSRKSVGSVAAWEALSDRCRLALPRRRFGILCRSSDVRIGALFPALNKGRFPETGLGQALFRIILVTDSDVAGKLF